jgi:hypothetical protein
MTINKTEIQRKIEINNFYKNLEANGLPLNFLKILETNGLPLEYLKVLTQTKFGGGILQRLVNDLKRDHFEKRIQWFDFYNEFFPESEINEIVLSVKIDQTRIVSTFQPNLLIVGGNITTEMLMVENNLGLPFRFKVEKGEDYNLCEEPERKGTYAAWTPGQNCSKERSKISLKGIIEDPVLKQIVLNGSIKVCSLRELLLRNMLATFLYGKPIDQGKVITRSLLCRHDQTEKLVGVDFGKNNSKIVSLFFVNRDLKKINKKEAENIFFCPID